MDGKKYQEKAIRRFWSFVDKNNPNGCWNWTLPLRIGYGRFSYHLHLVSAHRFSYELLHGKLDPKITLDHLCRNRACVNPSHLEPVSMRVNALRGIGPTAINSRKTHCIKGHQLSGNNVYIEPKGGRVCRACRRMRERYPPNKELKRLSDKRYRESKRKKCLDCGVTVHMHSLYCRSCSNIRFPRGSQFKSGHPYHRH